MPPPPPPAGSSDIKAILPPITHSCPIVRPQLITPLYRASTGESHAWAYLRAVEWDTMNSLLLFPERSPPTWEYGEGPLSPVSFPLLPCNQLTHPER